MAHVLGAGKSLTMFSGRMKRPVPKTGASPIVGFLMGLFKTSPPKGILQETHMVPHAYITPQVLLWMDEILHHLEPWDTVLWVGIYQGIMILGLLRWCSNSSIHSMSDVRVVQRQAS